MCGRLGEMGGPGMKTGGRRRPRSPPTPTDSDRHLRVNGSRGRPLTFAPLTGHALVELEQLLALLEGPQEGRQRAHVHGVAGDGQQVVQHARDLAARGGEAGGLRCSLAGQGGSRRPFVEHGTAPRCWTDTPANTHPPAPAISPYTRSHHPTPHQPPATTAATSPEQHADVLAAQGHGHVEQLLDGQHVRVLHAHHGHVVQPVKVGQALRRPG